MKKIIIGIILLLNVLIMEQVFAQTYNLTLETKNVIFYMRKGDKVPYKSTNFSIYRVGDNIAYCIDPSKNITTYNYVDNGEYINLNYPEELKEELILIGYYGREYPGHDNVRYSMAAQALIWEKTGTGEVTFWTMKDGNGSEIDVSSEREEILDLVTNHKKTPNISSNINGIVGEEIIIEDSSQLLNDFEVTSSNVDGSVSIENNKLHIVSNQKGDYQITLSRKHYDDKKTLIFVGSNNTSQTLGRLRFSNEVTLNLNIHIAKKKIRIIKVDDNNNQIKMAGIKFQIKNIDNDTYVCNSNNCLFETDNNGIIELELDNGNYQILEVQDQIVSGYTLNETPKNISVNENSDATQEVYFINKEIYGNLELTKYKEVVTFNNNQYNTDKQGLESVEFLLYDELNNYIDTLVTDSDGHANYSGLKLGTYYVIENSFNDDYIKDESKHYFTVKSDNQYENIINVSLEITNYLKKGTIEIDKIDSTTYEGIPNTIFEIYDINDNLLYTKSTDNLGKIILNNISKGKYYIKEKEVNYYYQKSNEKVFFEIKEHNDYIKLNLTNDKIYGTIEIQKYGEKPIYDNDITYDNIPLDGNRFLLYDEQNNLIDTLITDSNGYAKYDNLILGKYYVKEQNNIEDYVENNEKYYFEIKKDKQDKAINVKLDVNNYLKKGTLEFSKMDLTTSEGIPNTIIELYDINDNLLLERKTDELGKIIISSLPVGKYYLQEKEANEFYQITNEKVYFEILNNGDIVKANMTNEKKIIEVPKTGKNERIIYNSICIVGILISLGGIYFERKKAY